MEVGELALMGSVTVAAWRQCCADFAARSMRSSAAASPAAVRLLAPLERVDGKLAGTMPDSADSAPYAETESYQCDLNA